MFTLEGGRMLTNLRSADDNILLARSEEELQELVNRMDRISCKWGLFTNENKTKVMLTNRIV